MFRLRFPLTRIDYWAGRYEYPSEKEIESVVAPAAKAQGFLTREQFLRICEWKTARSRRRCTENDEGIVREATRIAFAAIHDPVKMAALRALRGVDWPTASVILHFCDSRPYPILDTRALWSLGMSRSPVYTDQLWKEYTVHVRELASSTGHSMRIIDRALWQYSKENQSRHRERK